MRYKIIMLFVMIVCMFHFMFPSISCSQGTLREQIENLIKELEGEVKIVGSTTAKVIVDKNGILALRAEDIEYVDPILKITFHFPGQIQIKNGKPILGKGTLLAFPKETLLALPKEMSIDVIKSRLYEKEWSKNSLGEELLRIPF